MLSLLAIVALAMPATASASGDVGPRGYEGPSEIGVEVPPVTDGGVDGVDGDGADLPPEQGEIPDSGSADGVAGAGQESEGGAEDTFAIEDESEEVQTQPEQVEEEGEEGEEEEGEEEEEGCDDGFCIEDLTEDEEALAKELEVPKVTVKGPTGAVHGHILDSTDGSPLIGAKITAVGTKYGTRSDLNGDFELLLPPGIYQIRVWYDAYEGVTISNVSIEADDRTTLNRELAPIPGMAQTVVVESEINQESAAGKLIERKKSTSSRDILSRDDIQKSGGGATSALARRIVSATVIDGRYLFVRGLGHRYGNTLFDGARVPSPDPNRRSVPLDIFPSGALSAINVQKTATPDVPGDFAGGSVQLESRQPPEEFSASLSAKLGLNTATLGREGLEGQRFAGDRVAFGN
ncbi:MAG TPA: TonB-dependent receptor, partial [Nannocystis exedens]|nr:TonB-dependent receptor [Nannocystis exedens]